MKSWFRGLKVSQKLMLISIFFVMPDSLMLYLFITGMNENIEFAEMEKKGNEYQRPLETLLELLPQHRRLAQLAAASGDASSSGLAETQGKIDAAFAELTAIDAKIGADLQFTDEGLAKRKREHCSVRTVRKEWSALKAELETLTSAALARQHDHLVGDIRTMITHAGDQSNLILDPDLDSYYLMDATLLALPQTQERLGAVIAHGETVLANPTLSNQERQQFAIYATLLREADLERIRSSVQTALNEDPNFYGTSPSLQQRIPPLLEAYSNAARELIQLTDRIALSDKNDVSAEEFLAAGNKTRDATFQLWRVADHELDQLLDNRIDHYRNRRTKSLIVAAFALLAALGFVAFITRSISDPLREQARELRAANQSLQAEMAERVRAEEALQKSLAALQHAQQNAAREHARFKFIFDSVPIGISWMLKDRLETRIVNTAHARISGVPVEHCREIERYLLATHPDDRARQAEFATPFDAGEIEQYSIEKRYVRSDGSVCWVLLSTRSLRQSDSDEIPQISTLVDITARKESEMEFEKINRQLIDASRQAGMAEVATGVLHNVGNVLNSVNVSATLVMDQVRQSKATNVAKLSTLFDQHRDDLGEFLAKDPRGQLVPKYLSTLADDLTKENKALIAELEHLRKNIEHTKDIVAMQQTYARVSGVAESVSVPDMIEDALRINAGSLTRHSVEVTRDYQARPMVITDKHKVMQILINFVRNAKFACDESGRTDKCIVIRTTAAGDVVRIAVSDNGVGIPAENLTRIFAHGFTTRKHGHGFGLHSAALAAKELRGAINVVSDGPGTGATFTLELPFHPESINHEQRAA